ncbi:MAG: cytochrome c oxidase subunit 3, partial [Pikeienuella sp.]
MAHEKDHDYHILAPSIWPFMGAVSAFVMLFGSVLYFHDVTPYIAIIGFLGVLYTMYAWWSDVIVESQAGDHTPVVRIGLRYGVILFITSEVMFFAAWFWSFFKSAIYPSLTDISEATVATAYAADGIWPPAGIETFDPWHLPLINTLIL